MKIWRNVTVILAVLGSVASLQAYQAQNSAPKPMMMQDCPMQLKDVEVSASDTPTGIALTFKTKPEQVEDLRLRVQRWGTMHAADSDQKRGMAQGMMAGTAKYEAIPNGARLTLTPKDPAKLAEFRATVRKHVEMMKKGDCTMMQQMMQGMMMQGMPGAQKPESSDKDTDHSQHHQEQAK